LGGGHGVLTGPQALCTLPGQVRQSVSRKGAQNEAGLSVLVVAVSVASAWRGSALCRADSFAYIERWATGTLTTGEEFESWRIHVVVPDGDDWVVSGIDGWLWDGPTWYYNHAAGVIPNPSFFTVPDGEFGTYWTSPHFYPNSDLWGGLSGTMDLVLEPTFVHLGGWFDQTFDTNGDYVVWQGTVLNPTPEVYGSIEFGYATVLEAYPHWHTFVIPEPATAVLLALGAWALLRRRYH
jgi:hypothetical protein